MDNQAKTMACGFAHCCAIGGQEANGKGGKLYVWGDNSDQQLQEHPKQGPKQVRYPIFPNFDQFILFVIRATWSQRKYA